MRLRRAIMERNPNLHQTLNDDCLIQICKYLSLVDKVKFLTACPQLLSYKSVIYKDYKKMDLKKLIENKDIPKDCSKEDIENIYKSLGKQVRILKISEPLLNQLNGPENHLISASIHSHYLQNIHLIRYAPPHLPRSVRFRDLRGFYLYAVHFCGDIFYMVPSITELYLNNVHYYRGESNYLLSPNCLHKLKSISIENCTTKLHDLIKCVSIKRKLKHFTHINSGPINFPLENMKFLKYLYSDSLDNVPLSRFEYLEFLIVTSKNKAGLSLKGLLEKGKLKVLDVGECYDFKDNASDLEACILKNTNLKYLNLPLSYFNEEQLQHFCDQLNLKPIGTFDIDFDEDTRIKFVVSDKNFRYFEYPSIVMSLFERMSEVANNYWERKCLLVAPELLNLCTIVYQPTNKRFKNSWENYAPAHYTYSPRYSPTSPSYRPSTPLYRPSSPSDIWL